MKKLFGMKNRNQDQWEEYDEELYDWDEVTEDDQEYYADEELPEGEAEYYEAETGYGEDAYEAEEYETAEEVEAYEPAEYVSEEDPEAYAAVDYAEEEAQEAYEAEDYTAEQDLTGVYYAEGAYEGTEYAPAEEIYYEGDPELAYEEEGYEQEYYEAEEVYEEEPAAAPVQRERAHTSARHTGTGTARIQKNKKKSGFAAFAGFFTNMSGMDRVITVTGVAVLILALVTGSVYISARMVNQQIASFAEVGTSLDGIELIGEEGLMAVANARMSMLAAAELVAEEEEQKEYDEAEYSKNVTVQLNMTSIQKDLKIKFVNKETGKLVANVPFQVTITTPDNKTENWSDDDMDGIIYKKDITPGKYKVQTTALTDAKYAEYAVPTAEETVEVKKDIEYKKVDVSAEVKTESQVNASKEDTKKNETVVESTLADTVDWVESTSTVNTYVEVSKSTVPDPTTLVKSGSFLRAAATGSVNPSSATVTVGGTTGLSAATSEGTLSNISWNSSNAAVASVAGNGTSATVTGVQTGTATISFTATATVTTTVVSGNTQVPSTTQTPVSGSTTVTVTEAPLNKGTISVNPGSLAVAIKGATTAQASVSGFTAGKTINYTASSSNTAVATAQVDASGKVTVQGVAAGDATITVTANYADGTSTTMASAAIAVKVTGSLAVALDKTTATVFLTAPVTINATVTGAATEAAVKAESSDTTVATVSVNQRAVTITGVKAGTATITVTYLENGQTVEAKCTITVKNHPKDDKTTLLKDTSGNQLYVADGNSSYREAVYADYYTADKFFTKGAMKYTGWQTLDGKVYFFKADGTKVTGEQTIQGAKYNFASDGSLVTGSGTMGIDVSKWNGSIDWNAVKNSGVSYVIIRCGYRGSSQGSLIEDPKYAANIKGATAAGLKVGVYFFTQAVDEREAVEEASMVLDLVKGYKISYPIFLDVEPSGGRADSIDKATRTAVCKAFCQTIQSAGYTAGVYANKTWLTSKIDASALSAYKIWLAQYAATPTYSGRYDLWQYKSNGKVSGISGSVDMNLSYLGY